MKKLKNLKPKPKNQAACKIEMKQRQVIKALLYISSTILAFLGILFIIASVFAPQRILTGFVFFALAGLTLFFGTRKPKSLRLESPVLRLAEAYNGKLTVSTVAEELQIPIDDAKDLLTNLARKGICYIDFEEVEKVGREVFFFPEFAVKKEREK